MWRVKLPQIGMRFIRLPQERVLARKSGGTTPPVPSTAGVLLLENGGRLLLEDGGSIKLENQ